MADKADSTREKIISSAFSFYDKILYEKIPLSKIALRAGITKPAIYRHFKSRGELEDCMFRKMSAEISESIRGTMAKNPEKSVFEVILIIFCAHKEYLYYHLSNASKYSFDAFFMKIDRIKSLSAGETFFDAEFLPCQDELHSVFFAGTGILFQVARDYSLSAENAADSAEKSSDFARKLSVFLRKGLNHDVSPLTAEKFLHLDEICREKETAKVDRVLKAASSIIAEEGTFNITIDSMAKKIGIAKSSLYTNFSSKNQMIFSLMEKEYEQLFLRIRQNMLECSSPAEIVYVIMETQLEYFMNRKEMIFLFRWFQVQNKMFINESDAEIFVDFYTFLRNSDILLEIPDLGADFLNVDETIFSWICYIPVFLLVHNEIQKKSEEEMHESLKKIFFMMEKGVEFDEK
jgi:AcrR family transcriptional regulator